MLLELKRLEVPPGQKVLLRDVSWQEFLTVTSYQLSVISFIVGGNTTPRAPFVVRRAVGISVGVSTTTP